MYQAAQNRYQVIPYRRCGASGLMLPAVSLGLWHNCLLYTSDAADEL